MVKQFFSQYVKQLSRYDTQAQLIRLLACMIVISCHIHLNPILDSGALDNSRLFVYCLTNDGVTIFFILSGCFLFSGKPIRTVIGDAAKNILLPVIVVCVLSLLLAGWVDGSRTLLDCLGNPQGDFTLLWDALLAQEPGIIPYCGHFWYVVDHTYIILLYPVLRMLCIRKNPTSRISCGWLVGLLLITLVLRDYAAYTGYWIETFSGLWLPGAYVVLGFLIYEYRDRIRGNLLCRSISALALVFIAALRFVLQRNLLLGAGSPYFYYWNTGCSALFSAALILFILSFRITQPTCRLVINYLGTKTFFIYMIHVLTHEKLTSLGFSPWLYESTVEALRGIPILGEALYTLGFVLTVFAICLAISILWEAVCLLFRQVLNRRKPSIPAANQ